MNRLACCVAVDGDVLFRRELPRTVGLSVTGGASADLTDIVVTTDTGERVELPDIAYRGNGPVTTGLALEADSYTVAVARDSAAGVTYLRIVNAMAEPVSVGLSQTLDALGIPAASRASAMATVLTADNPYAGVCGERAPTRPVERPCGLASGLYEAPAWSFTVIALK